LVAEYVTQCIHCQTGLERKNITPEMLDAKRQQLLLKRQLLKIKKEISNGLS